MSSQRFGKTRRVRRSREYQKAFKTGIRVHGRFVTLVVAPSGATTVRLGIVASRKLGDAVARNRAKRLIREVFRKNVAASSPSGADVVVIPRGEMLAAPYASLEEDFRGALRRGLARVNHGRG